MAEHLTTHSAIISFAFSFIDATAETLDSLEPILVVFSFTNVWTLLSWWKVYWGVGHILQGNLTITATGSGLMITEPFSFEMCMRRGWSDVNESVVT
jgi:hypothetical protein